MSSVAECRIVTLSAARGASAKTICVDGRSEVPFDIARVYYLYDVPHGASRGGHAHKALQQLIVAAAGSFDVVLTDGREAKTVSLAQPDIGLYVPRMIWRELCNFSAGSACLVLASLPYSEDDYIRHFDEFHSLKHLANAERC